MKRLIFSLTCVFSLVVQTAMADVIDASKALSVASQILGSGGVQMLPPKMYAPSEEAGAQTPAFYIFTGDGGHGFVVVSAEDAVRPVLAYSQDASIDELPDGMNMWLNSVSQQIAHVRKLQLRPTEQVRQMWSTVRMSSPDVLLPTALWNQGTPYNDACPLQNGKRTLTGCVPTAYAILLRYYACPEYGSGTTEAYTTETNKIYVPARDLNHPYDWSEMPTDNKFQRQSQRDEVARLMADVGAAMKVDYGVYETSGYLQNEFLIKHFQFTVGQVLARTDYSDEAWHKILKKELDEYQPVIYLGNDNDVAGHMFLLDGYTADDYYHVNWGWGGNYNGYFVLEAMTPSSGFDYSFNQWAHIGCVPLEMYDGKGIAQVGETICPDLNNALALANATGETVVLLEDIAMGNAYLTIYEDMNVGIDLNGHRMAWDEEPGHLLVYGALRIEDSKGGGEIVQKGNKEIISNFGQLTIEGGTFSHTLPPSEESSFSCGIYTAPECEMVIPGGKFEIFAAESLLLISGKVTITGGEFYHRGNSEVIYTAHESETIIHGGKFEIFAAKPLLYMSGKVTITGGEFYHRGNSDVITNYSDEAPLQITGGYFANTATEAGDRDYRNILYSRSSSQTFITGGIFLCDYGTVFSVNGSMEVKHAVIDAPNSWACMSWGSADKVVVFEDCMVSGKTLVFHAPNNNIAVRTGYFSHDVSSFVIPGSTCQPNEDAKTNEKYKYIVTNPDLPIGIHAVEMQPSDVSPAGIFSPAGVRISALQKGVNVVVTRKGKSQKVFVR